MELGWCCYDSELADPGHVAAVTRLRPKVVRWFLSVDRHVITNSPTIFPWAARYGAAFAALAAAGTPLVVQFQMKRPDWTAGDPGNLTGASAWKAAPRAGWPASPETKWLPFVDTVRQALDDAGVNVIGVGAWNEPDWRTCWPWENRAAPTSEWLSGQLLLWPVPPAGPFGWTGGHKRLSDLRALRPWTWTSDGVGLVSADWLARTAADPTVSLIDVHVYGGTSLSNALGYSCQVVDAFDQARSVRLPIVVGEYGDDANGTPYTIEWRDRALQYAAALEQKYPGRLVGVCAHIQGTRQGVTYPPLWTVL